MMKNKIRECLVKIFLYLSRIYFFGEKYECSCCGKKFRRFLNFNYKLPIYNKNIYLETYKNTICPYCLSLPRHRIICEYLNNNINLLKNKKILIFAAERGIKKWLDNRNIKYKTADLYEKADLKIDITDINLKDNSYDVVFCNHVLEHVDNYRKAIEELNRIIATNGVLICSVPIDITLKETMETKNKETKEERKNKYGQADHFRNFGLDFKNILESCKFSVKEINGDTYRKELRTLIGPGKYDYNHIFVCYKK